MGPDCFDGDATDSDIDWAIVVPCERGTLGRASSDSEDVRWWLYGECDSEGDGAVFWCAWRGPDADAGIGIGAVAELSVEVDNKACRASVMALTHADTSCAESAWR